MYPKQALSLLCYFVVCAVLIFMYGNYRCENPDFKDPLQTKLGIGDLDGWSLSHLLFFMFIGYHFKGKYLIAAFFIGVLWELFEHYCGSTGTAPAWLGGDCSKIRTDPLEGNWWYGKWSDIVMNLIGLVLGSHLLKMIIR